MFGNPRRGRQARNFTTNVLKILDLKSSSEQIFSENRRWVPLKDNDIHVLCSHNLICLELSNHNMILPVRRILKVTHVVKVKLFIFTDWKIRSCVWNDFSEIQELYKDAISYSALNFHISQPISGNPHQHLRMDWCYREKLLDGNCLGEKFD